MPLGIQWVLVGALYSRRPFPGAEWEPQFDPSTAESAYSASQHGTSLQELPIPWQLFSENKDNKLNGIFFNTII
jgi:hypothetical protein